MQVRYHRMRILSILLCIAMLAFSASTLAAAGDTGASTSINGNTGTEEISAITGYGMVNIAAYVYASANSASQKIVMLSKNIIVTYLAESGGYYQISYTNPSGKTYVGFMEKAKLDNVSASEVSRQTTTGSTTRAVQTGGSQPSTSISSALASAKQINSDVIGYISINGTNIQQPILFRSGDVHYYSTRNINQQKDNAGMVYTFYNNLYRNNTVTGHNMRGSNRLFHQLHHLQEKALGYSTCQHSKCPSPDLTNVPNIREAENRVWDITLLGYNRWEVFAMYEVKKDEPKSTISYNIHPMAGYSDKAVQEWIDKQVGRSEIAFNTIVSPADTFMTIYTCGTEYDSSTAQSRLYYFLKAVG